MSGRQLLVSCCNPKEGIMVSYCSVGLLKAELDEKPEWRRLYRSLVHHGVRSCVAGHRHLGKKDFTISQIKQLLRGYSEIYFKVEIRVEYFRMCESILHSYNQDSEWHFVLNNDAPTRRKAVHPDTFSGGRFFFYFIFVTASVAWQSRVVSENVHRFE